MTRPTYSASTRTSYRLANSPQRLSTPNRSNPRSAATGSRPPAATTINRDVCLRRSFRPMAPIEYPVEGRLTAVISVQRSGCCRVAFRDSARGFIALDRSMRRRHLMFRDLAPQPTRRASVQRPRPRTSRTDVYAVGGSQSEGALGNKTAGRQGRATANAPGPDQVLHPGEVGGSPHPLAVATYRDRRLRSTALWCVVERPRGGRRAPSEQLETRRREFARQRSVDRVELENARRLQGRPVR